MQKAGEWHRRRPAEIREGRVDSIREKGARRIRMDKTLLAGASKLHRRRIERPKKLRRLIVNGVSGAFDSCRRTYRGYAGVSFRSVASKDRGQTWCKCSSLQQGYLYFTRTVLARLCTSVRIGSTDRRLRMMGYDSSSAQRAGP